MSIVTDYERLVSEVSSNPLDSSLRRVLADVCEDIAHASSGVRARVYVGLADDQRKIADWLDDPTLSKAQESKLRSKAFAERCPVCIVQGDSPPTKKGERAYTTFAGSTTRVRYPGSARRKGCRLDYHPSTFRVEVGLLWLLMNRYWE